MSQQPPTWGAATLHAPSVRLEPGYAADLEAALLAQVGRSVGLPEVVAEHGEDLLLLPYRVPLSSGDWYGRLHQSAGQVLQAAGLEPVCDWLFLDLDPEGPARAWPELPSLDALAARAGAWLAYSTPKGVRLVWRLVEPLPVSRYAAAVRDLAGRVGQVAVGDRVLVPDLTSDQWNRLQRLPYATRRDGKYPELDGKPLPSTLSLSMAELPLGDWAATSLAPSAGRQATGSVREATDEDWALVFERDLAWAYDGELPEPVADSVYMGFRRGAWLIARRLVEVGEDPDPDRVGSFLARSWEVSGKPDSDWFSMLRSVDHDCQPDADCRWADLPAGPPAELSEELARAARLSVPVAKGGKAYSPSVPPSRNEQTWTELWVNKARAYGYSDRTVYYSVKEAVPGPRRGLNDEALWVLIRSTRRGAALRTLRRRLLETRHALSVADTSAPPVLEGQETLLLDYRWRCYRPLRLGVRSREERLRDYGEQCAAAGEAWVSPLVESYLRTIPKDSPQREQLEAERKEAMSRLFATAATAAPLVRLVGDTGEDSLGEWLGPGLFRAQESRSVLDPRIEAEYIPEADAWLRSVGGQRAERLLDWISVSGDTNRPCAALGIRAHKGIGKSLLINALGTLFGGYAEVSDKGWGDGQEVHHLVAFDEGAGLESMTSDDFRKFLTSRKRSVNKKYGAILEVVGYVRAILTGNDLYQLLPVSKSFSKDTAEAVASRLLIVEPGRAEATQRADELIAAVDARLQAEGVEIDHVSRVSVVARHLRWVIDSRRAATIEAGRTRQLVVEGMGIDALQRRLAVDASDVCYATVEGLLRGWLGGKNWDIVLEGDDLLVASDGPGNAGSSLVGDLWKGEPFATTVRRRRMFQQAFERARWRNGDSRLRGYRVDLKSLAEAMEEDPAELALRIQQRRQG